MGLFAINRYHIIVQGFLANFALIAHYFVISTKYYPEGDPEGIFYLLLALFVTSLGVFCSSGIFTLNHNLMKKIKETEAEKLEMLAKVIDGFVPICATCKSIRQEDGTWKTIESYLTTKSANVQLTHGICHSCLQKSMKDLENEVSH